MKKVFKPFKVALAALSFLIFIPATFADEDFTYWPDASYDPAVPTFNDVLGYDPGARITHHSDIVKYFKALETAAPERVNIFSYAETWEGRPLFYAIISSPENIANLDNIKAGMQALADPRKTNQADANALISTLPGVTWIAYGVHGNEISSPDAAMMTAYHLLASNDDEMISKILETTIVILDPQQNPDGRDRFVHNFEMSEGLIVDASRASAEHNEPWPFGRTNHYLFDLNRDWFAMTQPETVGKVKAFLDWFPLVYIDAHEMGSDASYYFGPQAKPFNPHTTETQINNITAMGQNNAKWFDAFGFDYFTREVFDGFYPGYGDSWPKAHGSVASTYEQASARGLAVRKYDGTIMQFRDTVQHHFVASISTAEFVADNRQALLQEFYAFRRSAIKAGSSERIKSYIIPTQNDMAGVQKMAGILTVQGIEVLEANAAFRACGTSYPAGSYVINAGQPSKRLIRNLMEANTPIEEEFMVEQERRRAKNLRAEIYDVTAWSLPTMYNVDVVSCSSTIAGDFSLRGDEQVRPGTFSGEGAKVAYLVPWGTRASGRLLAHALRAGLNVKSSDKAFTVGERSYPGGTLIFKVDDNGADLASSLKKFAEATGADVFGVDTSWASAGPNFGSQNVVTMKKPKVAILWDSPTNFYSAGNARFVIERQLDYPVTALRVRTIPFADLSEFDVIIMPEAFEFFGGYGNAIGKDSIEKLKSWVGQGGTLIAFGNAMRFVADPEVNLLSVRREDAVKDKENDAPEGKDKDGDKSKTVAGSNITSEEEFRNTIEPKKEAPDYQPGVMVRAISDADHWLAAGLADTLFVLFRGNDIYTPASLDKGVNVVRFADANNLLAGGYMWQENKEQLAYKPFVVLESSGKGYVIGFTQDPTVRAYLDGLNPVLLNAIFRASAKATRN